MRKILSSIIFLLLNLGFVYAFSEQDIISPVAGTWNNPQPLVLNIEDGTEIYYSYKNSNLALYNIDNKKSRSINLLILSTFTLSLHLY